MKADEKQKRKAEEKELPMSVRVRREIIAWFWVGLVFLLINGTLGQARVIPSSSMEKTLLIGDHLIMSRVGYDAGIPFTIGMYRCGAIPSVSKSSFSNHPWAPTLRITSSA